MSIFLTMAYLFFIGSVLGWVIELLFRNIVHHNKKWVNPGFCTGPDLPIYGFGLCTLYLLASLEKYEVISNPIVNKIVLFVLMAIGMTLIEYIAGLFWGSSVPCSPSSGRCWVPSTIFWSTPTF